MRLEIKTLFTLIFGLVSAIPVMAQTVPSLMNYQGRLTDETGAPLPDGTYRLAFRLYTNAIPTAQSQNDPVIWGREHDVSLLGGGFNVVLGASGAGPVAELTAVNDLAFAFGDANRFLELRVVRDAANAVVNRTILPRQQLLSAPYAFYASRLIKEFQEALCPPGTIIAFGGHTNVIPEGWLLCDGRAVASAAYPHLYSAIATNWGSGVTGDNFNLPDLRGMFLRGVSLGRNDGWQDLHASTRTNAVPVGKPETGGQVSGSTSNRVGSMQFNRTDHIHRWSVSGSESATESGNRNRTLRSWDINGSTIIALEDFNQYHIDNGTQNGEADNYKVVTPDSPSTSLYTQNALVRNGQVTPNNAYVHYIIKH